MTTTLTAVPGSDIRPVPWHQLSWFAWRRYRASLLTAAALLAVAAIYLGARGEQIRHAYAAVRGCAPQSAPACRFAFDNFDSTYGNIGFAGGVLVFLPAMIGTFVGAPLLAREFETGTFRYAWTQGAGRLRWLLALLIPGALGVAAASAALGALVNWYAEPLLDSGIVQRLSPTTFPLTGVAVLAWGLLSFAIGTVAGTLLRRVVPALAATLAVWTGIGFLAARLRDHYQSPLATRQFQLGSHDLPIQQWWSIGGRRASDTDINQVLQTIGVHSTNGGGDFQVGPGGGAVDPVQYLLQHGYTAWSSYQPDSRYWTFQAIEAGWLTALALILLTATLWLVHRRGA